MATRIYNASPPSIILGDDDPTMTNLEITASVERKLRQIDG
jgi:hypothetical protein